MHEFFYAFITSLAVTLIAIPNIISIAIKKNLVDVPDERRAHTQITPSLGGIGIFTAMLFSIVLWTTQDFEKLQAILCAFMIIFLVGVKDDIDPITPKVKLLGEFFAAAMIVLRGDIRISSFYGVFGIETIPYLFSVVLSMFVIIVIVNALNLIDGINGLSAGVASVICSFLGIWFWKAGYPELTIIAFALIGALIAFLTFNLRGKIFMGDTGSLLLGLVSSTFIIKFLEAHTLTLDPSLAFSSPVGMAIAILIIPLFDTARVFTIRVMNGKSPMHPDKSHLHHLLLDCGFSHAMASLTLVLVNLAFIGLAWALQPLGNVLIIVIILTIAIITSYLLFKTATKKKALKAAKA